MSNIVEFHRPKPRSAAKAKPPVPKLTRAMKQREWIATLAAIWANPKNWRRSKVGNAYIVIDDLDICVVIVRSEEGTGFQWEIRWRDDDKESLRSRWIYVVEQIAIDEAWTAVAAVA
jgi:hypothetical protein